MPKSFPSRITCGISIPSKRSNVIWKASFNRSSLSLLFISNVLGNSNKRSGVRKGSFTKDPGQIKEQILFAFVFDSPKYYSKYGHESKPHVQSPNGSYSSDEVVIAHNDKPESQGWIVEKKKSKPAIFIFVACWIRSEGDILKDHHDGEGSTCNPSQQRLSHFQTQIAVVVVDSRGLLIH